MSRRGAKAFWRNQTGATAALYALALPALVGVAGIAFDYARLAGMDSELQNAADQAALAAATQLDRQADAISRGTTAATTLVLNKTLFANDNKPQDIKDAGTYSALTVRFYATKANAEACGTTGALSSSSTNDASAAFVCVQVNARTANFALTPVVGALKGDTQAQAVAGIGSAMCRVPPMMICNPSEPTGNTDTNLDFNANNYVGLGLLATDKWAPGDRGFLDLGNGANGVEQGLGWIAPPGNCLPLNGGVDTLEVDTETGAKTSAIDAINTRFDIYDNCPAGGACPASINSVKDLVHPADFTNAKACTFDKKGGSGDGWHESSNPYLPASNAALPVTTTPSAMGHPRDICHSTSTNECGGPFGDGFWDRDAYFRTNYVRADGTRWTSSEWQANTGLTLGAGPRGSALRPGLPTRYQVYQWEIEHRGQPVDGVTVLGSRTVSALTSYGTPQCSNRSPRNFGTGSVPSATTADRRRVSVAVINCQAEGVNGKAQDVPVRKWIDVFLVEPSVDRNRTDKKEIYFEIIGQTTAGSAGESAGSVVRRDVPYLIR